MQYVIETKRLCKTYGGRTVVHNLDLHVPQGCVYGFIGPNGAGKSTSMKMLLGLVHPTAGSVALLGRTLTERTRLELLRQTGSLIESPSGYLHLTAQENLEIVADLKDVPYKDIDRVLEIVHLQADRKRKVGQYSLGMKQRLGIAMALLGSPRLLILDEPTNGLDPAGIQEMRALIHDMPDACGATVLISSHLLGEMEQIVSQVGIINHGQLLFEGPLAELQRHSRGNVVLRLLAPDRGAAVLHRYGLTPQPADNGCLLPTMEDARLATLVQDLAAEGAGVVGVERQTKNLEEIFLFNAVGHGDSGKQALGCGSQRLYAQTAVYPAKPPQPVCRKGSAGAGGDLFDRHAGSCGRPADRALAALHAALPRRRPGCLSLGLHLCRGLHDFFL